MRLSQLSVGVVIGVLVSGSALAQSPPPAPVSEVRLKNLYVSNSFDRSLAALSVVRAVTAGSFVLPIVGAVIASFKGPACDKARKLIEGLSTDGVKFKTSSCRDARKLAWDTALTGKSNWGFETRIELSRSLESGELALPGIVTDVSERSLDTRIARCFEVFRTLNQLTVTAGDVDLKKGLSHVFEFRGGCNVIPGGGVELSLTPVIYVN